MFLGGDIGGTKTNLALFQRNGSELTLHVEAKYPSQEHHSLDEIVQDFIQKNPSSLQGAAFGIAGPVNREHVKATNLPWQVDSKPLEKILNTSVHLMNDLEANAWGISILKKEELSTLHPGNPEFKGNRALISAGTGLGEAGLYFDGNKHLPFACEGGHSDFACRNDEEIRLFKFLSNEFGHVSFERVLSGQGLHNIYNFLLKDTQTEPSTLLKHEFKEKDPSIVISEHALNQSDALCEKALDMMVSFYGSEAGNLALKFMAYGGVYLGGGIAPKILSKLQSPLFIDSFLSKGRFRKLLENFSIQVILNPKAALLGAGQCALHRFQQSKK